jgi:hypothetical protein
MFYMPVTLFFEESFPLYSVSISGCRSCFGKGEQLPKSTDIRASHCTSMAKETVSENLKYICNRSADNEWEKQQLYGQDVTNT